MRSRWISLIAGLVVVVAIAACAPAAQPTPVPPKQSTVPVQATAAPAQPTTPPSQPSAAPVAPTAAAVSPTKSAVLTPAAAAGPSQALIDAAKAEGKVSWLTPFPGPYVDLLVAEFTKKYGITLDAARKGGPEVLAQVDAERRAGRVRSDVISGGDTTFTRSLAGQGVLTPYQPESAALVIPGLRDPASLYVPNYLSVQAMAYNTKSLKKEDLPKTHIDLTNPKWKGRLGSVRLRGTGAPGFWAQVILATHGWSFFEAMAKNEPMLINSASGLPPLALKGEVDIVYPLSDSVTGPLIKQGEPLAMLFAADVVPVGTAASVLVKDSTSPNAAKLLLDFMLRPEFQAKVAKETGSRATIVNVPAPEGTVSLEGLKLQQADTDWLVKNQGEMWDKFDDVFGFQKTK